jgi:hypothetical protein
MTVGQMRAWLAEYDDHYEIAGRVQVLDGGDEVSMGPCGECGQPSRAPVHPSCAGFRRHIRAGGTLD